MTPEQPYQPELRSIPLAFMDCLSHELKRNYLTPPFDGCLWDKLDLYECRLIRANHNCPRGFP